MVRRTGPRGRRVPAILVLGLALLAAGPPEAPVADAAMRGDRAAVLDLIARGADVNTAQGDGMTALHWAADRGDAELADVLLGAGAAAAPVTRIGQYTPLHIASARGHTTVVEALLRGGAPLEVRTQPGGATPLHLAAGAGDPALLQALLDAGADPNAREAEWEQTPLIFAAARNRAAAIRTLIAAGADPNATSRVLDVVKTYEVNKAAAERKGEILKALQGEDAERPPTPAQLRAAILAEREVQRTGEVPGAEDAEKERENDFGFPQRIDSKGGMTPLLHAARQGHLEAVEALLEGGADIDAQGAGDGTTALLMAAINGQFDVALLLLERGADPNLASTLNGATPLFAAINAEWQPRTRYPQPQEFALQSATYLDVMEALLKAGADPDARLTRHPWYMEYTGCGNRNCGLVDADGATAFWRAAYATDVRAMRLLVEHGADPDIPTKAPPQRERLTPDEFLARQHRNELTNEFDELDDEGKLKLLVSVRDDLPDSVQALYPEDAMAERLADVRTELLEHAERADSAKANAPDASGLPPVEPGGPGVYPINAASGAGYGEGFAGNAHRHVPDGWMAAVRYLVEELGADVNLRDHGGYTALHNAASRGDNEMIQYLVDHGGDVTAVSRKGQTTADMANGPVQRVSPFPETVELLERLGSKNNHNCLSC
ncbi:MAG: ankyrin repeat domain-containing protein [Gemmatimonadota bacterium]